MRYALPKLLSDDVKWILGELWTKKEYREYLFNVRNKLVDSVRKIKTGTIEGDALALQRVNGAIEGVESVIRDAQICCQEYEKRKEVSRAS